MVPHRSSILTQFFVCLPQGRHCVVDLLILCRGPNQGRRSDFGRLFPRSCRPIWNQDESSEIMEIMILHDILVGGFKHVFFFHVIYGMSSFPLTFICFRGLKTTNQIPFTSHLIIYSDNFFIIPNRIFYIWLIFGVNVDQYSIQ